MPVLPTLGVVAALTDHAQISVQTNTYTVVEVERYCGFVRNERQPALTLTTTKTMAM